MSVKGSNVPPESSVKLIQKISGSYKDDNSCGIFIDDRMNDWFYGTTTISTITPITGDFGYTLYPDVCSYLHPGVTDLKDPVKQEPFICPCCGGNSYTRINGRTVCDYCDTMFH